MTRYNHNDESIKHLRRRRLQQTTTGSRKGYYGDVEDLPRRDEAGSSAHAASAALEETSIHGSRFYAHIRPRRRNKRKGHAKGINNAARGRSANNASFIHPDIDLSLVSLVSTRELDRRFGLFPNANPLNQESAGSSGATSSSSSDIGNGSDSCCCYCSDSKSTAQVVNDNIIRKEKKKPPSSSTTTTSSLDTNSHYPLAVMDYGSIELDMSGSLLDSIYKIGGGGNCVLENNNNSMPFGGRRFSFNEYGHAKNVAASKMAESRRTAQASSPCNPGFTVGNSRGPEVEAVIASLKNNASSNASNSLSAKRGASALDPTLERRDCKKQKIELSTSATMERTGLPVVDELNTDLEAAISFSPFARVLFCAQAPFKIVHSNAAYSTLVQKGLVKPCIVGESFASEEHIAQVNCSEEEYIAKMVALHTGALKHENDRNAEEMMSRETTKASSGYSASHRIHIFPVISNEDMCSQLVRNYQNHHLQIQRMNTSSGYGIMATSTSTTANCNGIATTSSTSQGIISSQVNMRENHPPMNNTQYRSHYLLQIEHMSQNEKSCSMKVMTTIG